MKNRNRQSQKTSLSNKLNRNILIGCGAVLAFAIGIFSYSGSSNEEIQFLEYSPDDVAEVKKITSIAEWGAVDFEFNEAGGQLSWNLEAMRFADEFVVESSLDNKNFRQVGLQKAGKALDYTYTDKDIAFVGMPKVYYRLKMKGLDNLEYHSPIKVVEAPVKLGLYGFVEANSNEIRCFYAADESNEVELLIKNEQGKKVHQTKVIAEQDTKVEKLNTKALQAGNYTLYLINKETEFRVDFQLEG